jgi:hypothetical protein
MTAAAALPRRLIAGVVSVVLALSLIVPTAALAASSDPELLATLEHPRGDIVYEVELGKLHFFDEENAPFAVEVIDACAVDGHLWIFGVGLSGISIPLSVMDLDTGKNHRLVLPAYEPGKPIGTILEPSALPLCGDEPVGGLPRLSGTATFTAARDRGHDYADAIELHSLGSDVAYRRIIGGGTSSDVISRGSPIAAIDSSAAFDELMLLAEGRTPRRVEGVVFSGDQGMLPSRAELDKALKRITNARVRRAFEAAKTDDVPRPLIEDLGLRGVDSVHHVSLRLDTLGADAYLAEAGWIKEGGQPLEPPQPVAERFTVEITRADGETRRLPLTGPLVGSDAQGQRWEYGDAEALVQVIDGCALGGSFWTLAGAVTDEPLELTITDTESGTVAAHLVWTDYAAVSRISDSSSLPSCP